jgi:hypothetical protein
LLTLLIDRELLLIHGSLALMQAKIFHGKRVLYALLCSLRCGSKV